MNIDKQALTKIKAILAYFESGGINAYSQVSIYKDGNIALILVRACLSMFILV